MELLGPHRGRALRGARRRSADAALRSARSSPRAADPAHAARRGAGAGRAPRCCAAGCAPRAGGAARSMRSPARDFAAFEDALGGSPSAGSCSGAEAATRRRWLSRSPTDAGPLRRVRRAGRRLQRPLPRLPRPHDDRAVPRRRFGGYRRLLERGLDIVVAEARLRFRAPARFDDEIELEATVTHIGTTSLITEHRSAAATSCCSRRDWSTCGRSGPSADKTPIPDWARAGPGSPGYRPRGRSRGGAARSPSVVSPSGSGSFFGQMPIRWWKSRGDSALDDGGRRRPSRRPAAPGRRPPWPCCPRRSAAQAAARRRSGPQVRNTERPSSRATISPAMIANGL